jgi:glycosyltransferase involved in cell wall biosynthesis/trans-aconitate methyltransferase
MTAQSPASVAPAEVASEPRPKKRVAIFIVAYNAASTLRSVLDRIPAEIWEKVEEVFVFDDSSQDDTYLVGLGYKALHGKAKLTVLRNETNQGYGGNQILGYQYAISQGYDIVALLHGDGQYAPEVLPELLAPLERGEADAVFGSRMMERGRALRGGMPFYKYVGNKILTTVDNAALGMALTVFHSGYRLYSVEALKQVPFERNTHEFHFDTQIIIQFHAAGLRIAEIPIPTYYGDEICYVDGVKYAKDVVRSVAEFQLHNLGIQHRPEYALRPRYTMKKGLLSSHSQLLRMVGRDSKRVLDIGCGSGELGAELEAQGHTVTGVDYVPPQRALSRFIEADLNKGLPEGLDGEYDVAILADVLEHVVDSASLLRQAKERLAENGRLLVSLPNAVHWSMRATVASGRFDYTNKGILDSTHLRFFTQASARRLFEEAGLRVRGRYSVPVPWENVIPGVLGKQLAPALEKVDHAVGKSWSNLFAYQHIFELSES